MRIRRIAPDLWVGISHAWQTTLTVYGTRSQIVIDSKKQLEVVEEPARESSATTNNTPKDFEKQSPAPSTTPGSDADSLQALRKEIANLQVTNQVKALMVEQLQKDREHSDAERRQYIEELMNTTRKLGEMEAKLQQLEGAARAGQTTNAASATAPPP